MEVNLAIFIMAVGLLAMVALYPLAYRESRQSKDDVRAAAAADCILNTLTASLSSRNITWDRWVSGVRSACAATGLDDINPRNPQHGDDKGWLAYCKWESKGSSGSYVPQKGKVDSTAKQVFNALAGINPDNRPSWPLDNKLLCAIVAQWGTMPVYEDPDTIYSYPDYSRVAISVRVTRRVGELLSQPIFYTEIHFQGDQEELKE